DVITTPGNWQIVAAESWVEHPDGSTVAGSSDPFTVDGSANFAFNPATGALTFPSTYTNATAASQSFTVHLSAYIRPTASWTHNTSTTRGDTAQFTSSTTGTLSASEGVQLIEPNPSITKIANDDPVTAGQEVTYTLTATNANGRPHLFDGVVTDCVPVELQDVTLGTPTQGSAIIGSDAGCAGTYIVWTVGTIATGTPAVLTYTADVSPA